MLAYLATSSLLDLNWLLGVLGSGEKREPNFDQSSTIHILLLAIIIGIWWVLYQWPKNIGTKNPNVNEVNEVVDEEDHTNYDEFLLEHYIFESLQEEQEHPSGVLEQYFDGDDRGLGRRTAMAGGSDGSNGGRCGGCALCGNPCTTRCSRCKGVRYCSMECQIKHWRLGHKDECSEADEHGTSKLEKENTCNGSHGDVWEDIDGVDNIKGCEVCGRPSTTRCSRCKVIRYCSLKCLIMNWRWHKDRCIAMDVNSAPTKRPHKDAVQLSNYEGDNIPPLYLEYHHGTTQLKSSKKSPQDEPNKLQRIEGLQYLEEEVVKSRNEILLLQTECDEWKKKANFARGKFQSIKREMNYQLSALKNEKESISEAQKKGCNVIHNLQERLNQMQTSVQEKMVERELKQDIQMLKNENAKLKKELQEEQKRAQYLIMESDKSREIAQSVKREVKKIRLEQKQEHEHDQRLVENFRRDVIFAESKAAFVEAKLNDLHRKIEFSNCYKVCSICLANEKDLAFGCGHMTCRDCGSKLSKCPICRQQIKNHIRLFTG